MYTLYYDYAIRVCTIPLKVRYGSSVGFFFICIVSGHFSGQFVEWVILSKKYFELFSARPPVSMVTNKMAAILNKHWQIWNQCHVLLNKDIIIILAESNSVGSLLHSHQKILLNIFFFFL